MKWYYKIEMYIKLKFKDQFISKTKCFPLFNLDIIRTHETSANLIYILINEHLYQNIFYFVDKKLFELMENCIKFTIFWYRGGYLLYIVKIMFPLFLNLQCFYCKMCNALIAKYLIYIIPLQFFCNFYSHKRYHPSL